MRGVKKHSLLIPIFIAFLLSFTAIYSQSVGKVDRFWSDIVSNYDKKAVKEKYLIVDITADDMSQSDVSHLSRKLLAETLDRLNAAGTERVLLDVVLLEELSSIHDDLLVTAISSFGANRIALPEGGASKFNAHATPLDLDLLTDADGWTRSIRTLDDNVGYNPAIWLATGELSKAKADIDLRYDPTTIERITLSHMHESNNRDLSDYNVIISLDPVFAASRIRLPLSDVSDRSGVIAVGGHSISANYQKYVKKARIASLSIAFIFMLIGVYVATISKKIRLVFLASFVVNIAALALNIPMMKLWGVPGYPMTQTTSFVIGVIVTIAYRLRLFQMALSFFRGDLSPEEALIWRAHEDNENPVILLNSMGHIRRMNPAAKELKTMFYHGPSETDQFDFKKDMKNISLNGQNGGQRQYALEWPNHAVAIIILKDVTEVNRKYEDLLKTQDQAIELAKNNEIKRNQAEAISKQKSDFLAHMSHELRTPLNSINGFSDILRREIFGPLGDPRYNEFVESILASGQHLLSLINDILDLSKIESGKMKLKIEQIQINEMITQAMQMVSVRAKEAQLKLIYENANLPDIKADSRAVKQILLNLLTNAIKFTLAGGVVKVSTEYQYPYLLIHVADSGIGISQKDIERLAQPFEQVESEDTKNIKGTGLGLSLSKSLTELHGGTFKIQSAVGKGTRVTFSLPYQSPQQLREAG